METPYDWVTVAIFAGLIVLFLDRSSEEEPRDKLWQYLAASVGCALANYVGNKEQHIAAIAIIIAVLGYIWFELKPLDRRPKQ